MKINKYPQLNVLTFIAIIMIFTIHYFNYFAGGSNSIASNAIISILRGFALIAVPIFVANIAYTHLYLEKSVSYKKLLIYIIIPTIILTFLNHYFFDKTNISWSLKKGFSGSWFGNMYIGLMLSMPLLKKIYSYRDNKLYSNIIFVCAIIVTLIAYYLSIKNHTATLLYLGNLVFIPYLSMLVIYDYLLFRFEYKNTKVLILLLIIGIGLQALAYYPDSIISNKHLITSYFSPVSYLYTFSIYKLIYNSNFTINKLREVSQTSYFFYFTHYSVLSILLINFKEFTLNNPLIVYPFGLVASIIISYLSYNIYLIIIKTLQLDHNKYSN